MKIPLVDLQAQYQTIRAEVTAAVTKVMDQGDFILGSAVHEFEKSFADYIGTRHCLGVASGLDALALALRALGVGPGDEVICPANTFIATVLPVSQLGAKPVLVDVVPGTFNMDPSQLEKVRTCRTRAVIPVHLCGQPADMDTILAFAARHKLAVVEDACQAHGARYRGRRCGSLGDIGCFSFYPGKNLGAYGDGGAVTTNNPELARKIELLRNYGQEVKYKHVVKGVNSRLDTMQAAVLNVKLKHLDDWNRGRARNARLYEKHLAGIPSITVPTFDHDVEFAHVFHLFMIRCSRRDELLAFLKDRQVFCGIHYPTPIHLLDAYQDLGYTRGDFPETEKAAGTILSLPLYAELTEEQVRYVSDGVRAFFAGSK
jgi:dTDP-4-amino-4,6-dideoxygalactose transaminase